MHAEADPEVIRLLTEILEELVRQREERELERKLRADTVQGWEEPRIIRSAKD